MASNGSSGRVNENDSSDDSSSQRFEDDRWFNDNWVDDSEEEEDDDENENDDYFVDLENPRASGSNSTPNDPKKPARVSRLNNDVINQNIQLSMDDTFWNEEEESYDGDASINLRQAAALPTRKRRQDNRTASSTASTTTTTSAANRGIKSIDTSFLETGDSGRYNNIFDDDMDGNNASLHLSSLHIRQPANSDNNRSSSSLRDILSGGGGNNYDEIGSSSNWATSDYPTNHDSSSRFSLDLMDGASGRNLSGTEEPDDHRKTIRFASQIAVPIDEMTLSSPTAKRTKDELDVFDDELYDHDGSSRSFASSFNDDDDDDSFVSAVSEEDEDARLRKSMMYAAGGAGLMFLLGFAFRKIMNAFSNSNDVDGGGVDGVTNVVDGANNINDIATLAVGGDGGASSATTSALATEAANQAAQQAALHASQSQISSTAVTGLVGNQGATATMSAAQTQVLQGMAVNAGK